MAKRFTETVTRGLLLTTLAVLAIASVVVITLLLALNKATVVELDVRVDEVSFTVVPPRESAIELLRPLLEVRDLQWEGADRFEATLATPQAGRAMALPERSSVIGLGSAADESGAGAFMPVIRLRRPMRLKLEPEGLDSLTMTLDPVRGSAARRLGFAADPEPGDWICQVPPREDLELRLRGVELVVNTERLLDPAVRLESAASAIVFMGGTRKAELGLQPVLEPQGLTALYVINPQTGEVEKTGKGLSLKLPNEPLLIPMGERLVLLEREAVDPEARRLLAPGLTVVAPAFFRGDVTMREESFLVGGQIRFPAGEKEPVELRQGFLLRVSEQTPLQLRSLRMVGGNLELVLWGKPASLELGPTSELMDDLLPSVFEWLSTHGLPQVYSVLGMLLAAVLGLLRLLGLVKKGK